MAISGKKPVVVIIGAGPAGLTAAYELAKSGRAQPVVLEGKPIIGGISATIEYHGNRIDIGGHRFFSKSERVMQWWSEMLPVLDVDTGPDSSARDENLSLPDGMKRTKNDSAEVMLIRPRKSSICYEGKFYDYPLNFNARTFRQFGLAKLISAGTGYLIASIFPRRPEMNLEDFLINRFGKPLYHTFFKSYTEKVWGRPCSAISAEWGVQRIKGLSMSKAALHALDALLPACGISRRGTETSLIESFLYPRLGPGQLWEVCARKIASLGGQILLERKVVRVNWRDQLVESVVAVNAKGEEEVFFGDIFISSMPVKDLLDSFSPAVPESVSNVSRRLPYRDFLTVGLLFRKLAVRDEGATGSTPSLIKDNWIYIQEPGVMAGRIQVFNNWSRDMVASPDETVWLGLEYFCQEGDGLWRMPDNDLIRFAAKEIEKTGIANSSDVLDGTVIRMPKAYPAYFGAYQHFGVVRSWVEQISNLFLVGRNGMHRYNNQDHSMLTAMFAADQILEGRRDTSELWDLNTEEEYHEKLHSKRGK